MMLAKSGLRKASSKVLSPAVDRPRCVSYNALGLVKPGESSRQPSAPAATGRPSTQLRVPAVPSAVAYSGISTVRAYSTNTAPPTDSSTSPLPQPTDDPLTFETEDAWASIFHDIDHNPPIMSSRSSQGPVRTAARGAWGSRRPRQHSMTVGERSAFDDMFHMIFDAVDAVATGSGARQLSPAINAGRAPMRELGGLFGRLRSHSRRTQWTNAEDEELDRKREAMGLCDTDMALLEWAMREVFGESRTYEEAARRAMEDRETTRDAGPPVQLQPASYPHVLALLIQTFREKYRDPHLALSMFDYARHLSIPSFVFGCTTPVYNELIETKWRCFRDLRGVCDALEEMRVNGVDIDSRTRTLAEMIRREVSERNLWQEETTMGGGEVWDMVMRIEQLTIQRDTRPRGMLQKKGMSQKRGVPWLKKPVSAFERKKEALQERWKEDALQENSTWVFGQWEPTPPEDQRVHAYA